MFNCAAQELQSKKKKEKKEEESSVGSARCGGFFFFFSKKTTTFNWKGEARRHPNPPPPPLSPSLTPVLSFLNLIFSAFHIYNLVTPSLPSPPAPSSPPPPAAARPPPPTPTTHFCHQPVLTSNASLSVCLHPISGRCSLRNKDPPPRQPLSLTPCLVPHPTPAPPALFVSPSIDPRFLQIFPLPFFFSPALKLEVAPGLQKQPTKKKILS